MRKQVRVSKSPEGLIKAFSKQHFPDFSWFNGEGKKLCRWKCIFDLEMLQFYLKLMVYTDDPSSSEISPITQKRSNTSSWAFISAHSSDILGEDSWIIPQRENRKAPVPWLSFDPGENSRTVRSLSKLQKDRLKEIFCICRSRKMAYKIFLY